MVGFCGSELLEKRSRGLPMHHESCWLQSCHSIVFPSHFECVCVPSVWESHPRMNLLWLLFHISSNIYLKAAKTPVLADQLMGWGRQNVVVEFQLTAEASCLELTLSQTEHSKCTSCHKAWPLTLLKIGTCMIVMSDILTNIWYLVVYWYQAIPMYVVMELTRYE